MQIPVKGIVLSLSLTRSVGSSPVLVLADTIACIILYISLVLFYYFQTQDVFNTADPLPSEQTIQIYHNYLEEIEEDNHKRKLEDEEYEKRKQKLVCSVRAY